MWQKEDFTQNISSQDKDCPTNNFEIDTHILATTKTTNIQTKL